MVKEKENKFKTTLNKKYIFIGLLALFLVLTVFVSYKAVIRNGEEIPQPDNSEKVLVGEIDITGITNEDFDQLNKNLSLTVPEDSAYCIGVTTNNLCEGTIVESGIYEVTCYKESNILALCYASIPLENLHEQNKAEETCGENEDELCKVDENIAIPKENGQSKG